MVSDTYRIVQAMKATGNRSGIIAQWKADMEAWANFPLNRLNPDAAAVRAWLPLWKPRQLYTAAELAPIWPMIAIALEITKRIPQVPKSAGRLANELDFERLPSRLVDIGRGAELVRYYSVERLHHWRAAPDAEWKMEVRCAFT